MGDEEQRAVVLVERSLELLDRRQVEVIRRFVEHEAIRALRRERGQHGARALAGRKRRARAKHVIGAESELREHRARFVAAKAGRGDEPFEQRAVGTERAAGLVHLAETREQAYKDVEHGIVEWFDYFQHTAAFPQMAVGDGSTVRQWLRYPNTYSAATERRDALGPAGGDSVRAMLLGFSLDYMTSTVRRNLFLYRTLVEEFENPSCYAATGVPVSPPAEPSGLARLYPAVPNPFNPRTMIRFELARGARTRLRIFAVDGSLVRTVVDRVYPAGEHRVYWDGQSDRGRDVGSGAYFVSLVPGLAKALQIDGFQISLEIVAALLTIIGYSVNDTIREMIVALAMVRAN